MKTNLFYKKLTLKKQTLVDLNGMDMKKVQGGWLSEAPTLCYGCKSHLPFCDAYTDECLPPTGSGPVICC